MHTKSGPTEVVSIVLVIAAGVAGASVATTEVGCGSSASSGAGTGTTGGPPGVASGADDSGQAATSPEDAGAAADGAALSAEAGAGTTDAGAPGMDAAATSNCTSGSLQPGETTVTIQHAGANRNYILHVPPGYTGNTPVPLLIDMHGSGQDATQQKAATFWVQKADTNGFIVIYPNALNMRWNAGTCCSPSVEQNVDDVGFLRAVVEKTAADGCIDRKRVYASGLSGGGLMAYRLGCQAADVFAAIAPVSGATVESPCTPSRPVTVVAFRGTMDNLVPYDGGMPLQWYFQGAKADFDQWSRQDQCTGTPTTNTNGVCQTDSQCAGGAEVTLCTINGGHVLYGAAQSEGAAVPDVAWQVFKSHPMP